MSEIRSLGKDLRLLNLLKACRKVSTVKSVTISKCTALLTAQSLRVPAVESKSEYETVTENSLVRLLYLLILTSWHNLVVWIVVDSETEVSASKAIVAACMSVAGQTGHC